MSCSWGRCWHACCGRCGDCGYCVALVVIVCLRWKGDWLCGGQSATSTHHTMHPSFINAAAVSLLTPLVVVVAVALHNEPNTQSLCCCIEVPRQQRKHWHLYVQTKPNQLQSQLRGFTRKQQCHSDMMRAFPLCLQTATACALACSSRTTCTSAWTAPSTASQRSQEVATVLS